VKNYHDITKNEILFHREDGKDSRGPLQGILHCLLRNKEHNKGKAFGSPNLTLSGGMERQSGNLLGTSWLVSENLGETVRKL
jgi:hypothetical protein